MAQSIFLPAPTVLTYSPNSPDPTPLRMIAFSVAESVLQADPSSPFMGSSSKPQFIDTTRSSSWESTGSAVWDSWADVRSSRLSSPSKASKPLWDVVERAKERREKEKGESCIAVALPY
jgi:hypothetical protein